MVPRTSNAVEVIRVHMTSTSTAAMCASKKYPTLFFLHWHGAHPELTGNLGLTQFTGVIPSHNTTKHAAALYSATQCSVPT